MKEILLSRSLIVMEFGRGCSEKLVSGWTFANSPYHLLGPGYHPAEQQKLIKTYNLKRNGRIRISGKTSDFKVIIPLS